MLNTKLLNDEFLNYKNEETVKYEKLKKDADNLFLN